MIILAFISAGLCVGVGLLCRTVFRWGNRGRKRTVTDLRLEGPSRKGFSTDDPVAALAALALAATTAAATTAAAATDAAAATIAAADSAAAAAADTLADTVAATVSTANLLATIASGGDSTVHYGARAKCTARARRLKVAVRRRWRAGAACRGALRRQVSWSVNFVIFFMLNWMVVTYAMQFGDKKTREWLLSLVMASVNAWLIIEPVEVILIAFLPQLLENKCVANCREFAKEMGFY